MEPTMELVPFLTDILLRSPDIYDPIADLSTEDRVASDQSTHGSKCSSFSVHNE